MIELFKHIIHLDFDWLFLNYDTHIYFLLFLVIFIETGLVIMPFLPGDSLLFAAGLCARMGQLNILYLISLLFVAAVVGDNLNYLIGRTLGLKVMQFKFRQRILVKQEYLDRTQLFFEKYGSKTIIMARFVPFVRTFTPFAAGIAKMKYFNFILFDLFGGALWICSLCFAGYFLGKIEWIAKHIELVAVGIIIISVLPMIGSFFGQKKNHKE